MGLLRKLLVSLLSLVAATAAGPLWAQSDQGTLRGVVNDAIGAALSGATITVAGEAGGFSATAVTSRDGSYSVGLPPGRYSATASFTSFRDQTRTGIEITAGATATADFELAAKLAEEITVTATKREEELRDVPFSVAAPTENALRRRGAEDLEGVAANVVGFSVQNLGPGQSQVAIRGVSAGQIVRDQPGVKEQVGVYLDESTISMSLFTPDMDLFDMSRIEVLRGPQGTLFGSGSLSGTVRYITNQPELGVQRTFGEVGGGSLTGGELGGNAKLGANLPLGDAAALRVAAYYNKLGGYMDAVQPDLSLDEDVNDGERTGVRAALRIQPNDSFTVTPRVFYQKVEMKGWNRKDAYNILANPFTTTRPAVQLGERQLFTQFEEPFTDEFLLADLTLDLDLGDVELTSVTSYTDRDVLVVRDATALTASITGGSIGFGADVYTIDGPLDDATQAKVFTQELRLAGASSRFAWVVGGFLSDMDRDYAQDLLVDGFEALTGIPTAGSFGAARDVLFYSDLQYQFKQLALFGEGSLNLGEDLTLTAGLRFYDFDEDRVQTFDGIFAAPGTNPGDTTASGLAPRFLASYRAGETTINAQASKGFRLGGINDPLNVPLCTPQDLETFGGREAWEDETAWNYEIGTKSTILGGRGSFNASAFYIDIRDLQATVTAGSCSSRVIFNVPKARSAGFEVELAATPNENFDVAIAASYNDAELRSTLTSTDAAGNVSVVSGIEEGNRLPSVPELQLAAAATYQWLTGQSVVYLTGVFQHVGSRFTQIGDQAAGFGTVNLLAFEPNTIGSPLTQDSFIFDPELPSYNVLNFRLGLLRGPWDVALYVNNATDERALLALDQERGTLARVGFLTNPPRSFGVSAKFRF
jgi:iron complex outermembrane receptor protein